MLSPLTQNRYYSIPSGNDYNTDVLRQGDIKVRWWTPVLITVIATCVMNAGSRPQFVTVQGKLNGVYAKTTANLADRYAALNFAIPEYIISTIGAAVAGR